MNEIKEIKQRLPIEELVGEYVQLKKTGKNFKGLCPWHQEKTPSFIVSPDSGICRCFGQCQKGGDIFKFLEYTENLEFKEALEVLATKTGVILQKKDFKKSEEKTSQIEILEEINNFYQEKLDDDAKISNLAKKYLVGRKLFFEKDGKFLRTEIGKKFEIGLAPDDSSLIFSHLRKLGFEEKDIFKTGVILKNEHGSGVYDRFKGRIIFPIKNLLGKTIGFGGRIFRGEENSAKYLNSSESSVFDKSMNLYGLNFAKDAIRKKKIVILTEGYMDTIACHRAGFDNAVASLGTAFNEKHVKILKRYTENFYLCFDSDLAGIEAIKRAFEVLNDGDTNIKIVKMLNGKDPDEAIENDVKNGTDFFKKAIENPLDIVEFLFFALQKKYDLKKIEDKKLFQKEIFQIISSSKNNLEKQEYLKKISFLLGVSENFLFDDFQNFDKKNKKIVRKNEEISDQKNIFLPENYLIGLILFEKKLLPVVKENLLLDFFEKSEKNFKIFEKIFEELEKNIFDEEKFFEEEKKFLQIKLQIESQHDFDNFEKLKLEALSLIKSINLKNLEKKEKFLKKNLNSKEKIGEFQSLLILKNKILKK
ncbi:DNA primase [Candidatus Gracilibacteria bacterium]|nr:DNA primase [Candidatus Gracilibacteria bacterium]